SIKYLVANDNPHTPDETFINSDNGLQLEAEFRFQTSDELGELLVRHGVSAGDVGLCRAFVLVPEQIELARDIRKQQNAVVIDQQTNQVLCPLGHVAFDQTCEQVVALFIVQTRVGECLTDLVVIGQLSQPGQEFAP